jgi:hypothetical protein
MKNIVWINDYNMNFMKNDNQDKIFIFSKKYIANLSYLRLEMIYNKLMNNNIQIFKGEYEEVINNLYSSCNIKEFIVPNTLEREINNSISKLDKQISFRIIKTDAILFKELSERKYFKFWNKIKSNII